MTQQDLTNLTSKKLRILMHTFLSYSACKELRGVTVFLHSSTVVVVTTSEDRGPRFLLRKGLITKLDFCNKSDSDGLGSSFNCGFVRAPFKVTEMRWESFHYILHDINIYN